MDCKYLKKTLKEKVVFTFLVWNFRIDPCEIRMDNACSHFHNRIPAFLGIGR